MPTPLVISRHQETRLVEDAAALRQVLLQPDRYGGGEFWLAPIDGRHPHMAIRLSSDKSDVHYFPSEGHPGFRRLATAHAGGAPDVTFRFEGCDPDEGELVPAIFVLPLSEAVLIATKFMQTGSIREPEKWFEL